MLMLKKPAIPRQSRMDLYRSFRIALSLMVAPVIGNYLRWV
jgi:hypothetical protein